MAIAPITGMLRRGLIVDLSIALGLGLSGGCLFWYGVHVPKVQQRDRYYTKLEEQRAANAGS
ncbi:hypothetical protein K3495_g5420 [Podosphaera aphanis]|nr:hypothetical protein K3495_g5420 [Podosphaera aphanis]